MSDNTRIIKSFSNKSEKEIDQLSLTTFRSWESFSKECSERKKLVALYDDELVEGIVVDSKGITFKIGKKKQL